MQANAYLSTNEKIKLTPHMLRHSFLKRVADKHGLYVAQNLNGNVSIKEILDIQNQITIKNTIWFRNCFNTPYNFLDQNVRNELLRNKIAVILNK
jgi:hypothetical protein